MFSLSTLHFKVEELNDLVHIILTQDSRHSKQRTLKIDHMHVHGSVTYGCQTVRNKLIGDVTGRHLNVRNRRRLSPFPPHPPPPAWVRQTG